MVGRGKQEDGKSREKGAKRGRGKKELSIRKTSTSLRRSQIRRKQQTGQNNGVKGGSTWGTKT